MENKFEELIKGIKDGTVSKEETLALLKTMSAMADVYKTLLDEVKEKQIVEGIKS